MAGLLLAALLATCQLIADEGYDANALRYRLQERGTQAVVPIKINRKTLFPLDAALYHQRNTVERMFCRLKDFRRIATRYDTLARNFLSALCLATTIAYWVN